MFLPYPLATVFPPTPSSYTHAALFGLPDFAAFAPAVRSALGLKAAARPDLSLRMRLLQLLDSSAGTASTECRIIVCLVLCMASVSGARAHTRRGTQSCSAAPGITVIHAVTLCCTRHHCEQRSHALLHPASL